MIALCLVHCSSINPHQLSLNQLPFYKFAFLVNSRQLPLSVNMYIGRYLQWKFRNNIRNFRFLLYHRLPNDQFPTCINLWSSSPPPVTLVVVVELSFEELRSLRCSAYTFAHMTYWLIVPQLAPFIQGVLGRCSAGDQDRSEERKYSISQKAPDLQAIATTGLDCRTRLTTIALSRQFCHVSRRSRVLQAAAAASDYVLHVLCLVDAGISLHMAYGARTSRFFCGQCDLRSVQ